MPLHVGADLGRLRQLHHELSVLMTRVERERSAYLQLTLTTTAAPVSPAAQPSNKP